MQRVVSEETQQLGEIVPRTDRDDPQCGVRVAAQQPVRHFMDSAVATDRHHVLGPLADGLRRQHLGVTGTLGADDIHRPPLRPECARDDRLDAACRASPRSRIEDDIGMKHAADKISSRLPRKGLQS